MSTTRPSERPLYSVAQVRELDRRAARALDISGYELMMRAAAEALRELRARWPRARRIRVVCGAGNNAGDGYVLARLANAAGLDARVGVVGDPDRLRDAARTAWEDARNAGVPLTPFTATVVDDAEVIVDALFGTGLDRPLTGGWLDAVEAINRVSAPVLALDVPSGLHADTGAVLGAAVRAALTVTFIVEKPGLYTGRGPGHAGQVVLAPLGVRPDIVAESAPVASRLEAEWLKEALPARRSRDAHKGAFGHVLVIGGQPGMSGAARLAAEAAARVGAGLVSVATHPGHAAVLNCGRPELMVHAVHEVSDLQPLLDRATALVVGPGIGQSDWARGLLARAWESALPTEVDADALNLLAGEPARRDGWVLTPHPGEAARLLQCTAAEIEADRLFAAREIQRRYGGVVVLKGAGTVVADAAVSRLITHGNPGMASGGMGDVLAGVIGGLCAQRLSLSEAAAAGALMHALAGDAVAEQSGERGILAADLFPELRRLVNCTP